MTAAELLTELDVDKLREWARLEPVDSVKVANFDQIVADLLACIDALKAAA